MASTGRRLDSETEQYIVTLSASGMSPKEIAAKTGVRPGTVRKVLQRTKALELPAVDLPALSDRRMSPKQVLAKIRYVRDCCTELAAGVALPRLKADLEGGRDSRSTSTTLGTLLDKIIVAQKHLEDAEAPRRVPKNEQQRERMRLALLLRQANGGSVRATVELARALGLSEEEARDWTFEIVDATTEGDTPDRPATASEGGTAGDS